MEIGQAMLINASESLGTPASIGWLSKIHYDPHTTVMGGALKFHLAYPAGLFSVWVCDTTGDAGNILVDLCGRVFAGPPSRDGVYPYWP